MKRRGAVALLLLILGVTCCAIPFLYGKNDHSVSPDCIGDHHVAHVNGVDIYYEEAGNGKPVILLHGNGGSHKDLSATTGQLVRAGYKVYAVDSRGQGASSYVADYHYCDMADDVYELIREWHLEKPALYGWSDGGIIGLLLEINHPGSLGLLAASGANVNPDGIKGFYSIPISAANAVCSQSLTDMILNEPDITEKELGSIRIPVLVTAGSDDMIKTEHTKMIAESIPDAELVIYDGESHGSYILGSEKIGNELIRFFKENGF